MNPLLSLDDMLAIGHITRTHGVEGEMVVLLEENVDLEALHCLFLDIDGLLVPFFADNVRPRSAQTDLVKLHGVDSENEASQLCGKMVYAAMDEPCMQAAGNEEQNGFYATDFIGFQIASDDDALQGEIIDIDDSTPNYLFVVKRAGNSDATILIPVAEEYIRDIYPEHKKLLVTLPEGFLANF